MKPLLDPIQVGEILGISPRTVNQLCNQKKLQFIQVDSKHRRFTEQMVEAFLRDHTAPVIPPPNGRKRGGTLDGYPLSSSHSCDAVTLEPAREERAIADMKKEIDSWE